MHDLDPVAGGDGSVGVGGARNDLKVPFHRHLAGVQAEHRHQTGDIADLVQSPLFAVDPYMHVVASEHPALVTPRRGLYKTGGIDGGALMPKPIYVLNGPNLNLLGTREPDIYGSTTLADVQARCAERGRRLGFEIVFRQTNLEGELIDWVQEAGREASAIVINPAGYGHTSVALLDALKAVSAPIVECHLSHLAVREDFRRETYVSLAAKGLISGFGATSYELAIEAAAGLVGAASGAA